MPIDALPPELLCLILEFAVQDSAYSTRWAFLRSTALLSSAWCGPSQATLWSSLKIAKQETGRKWLASHASKGEVYATYCLDLAGMYSFEEVDPQTATEIVGRCVGVKRLRLTGFKHLSAKVLESHSLDGLQSLTIATRFTDTASDISSLRFPFHLRGLHLYDNSYSPALVSSLFGYSSSSLATLSLSLGPLANTYSTVVSSFHLVAASLRELTLNRLPGAPLIAEFKGCANLKLLNLVNCGDGAGVLGSILDSIPSALETLKIRPDFKLPSVIRTLRKRLEIGASTGEPACASLRQLRTLEVKGRPHSHLEREDGGRDFVGLCRQLCIELKTSGD